MYTGYFTSDNEPDGIENETHTIHCQKKTDILILIFDFFWQCIVGCILNAVVKYPVCVLHYCNLCRICAFGDKDGTKCKPCRDRICIDRPSTTSYCTDLLFDVLTNSGLGTTKFFGIGLGLL
jgi:hypothetical protein